MAERVELLIVGAGPAGLAAAQTALDHGIAAMLLDEQPGAGGQIYRGVAAADAARRALLGPDYAEGAALLPVLARDGLRYRPGACVWQVTPDRTVLFTQEGEARAVQAERIVLATGALERPMPFPGWTLPGVMTCGAAQILLKSAGLVAAERVVLAGSGPLLLLVASQLLAAGAEIAAIVETTPRRNIAAALRHLPLALRAPEYLRKGLAMTAALRRAGIPWHRGATGLRGLGEGRIEALRFAAGGAAREVPCELLLLHQGVVPNVQMSRALELAHDWDAAQRAWRPCADPRGGTALPGIAVAGDCAGIVGANGSALQGRLAALQAAFGLGALDEAARDRIAAPLTRALRRERAVRPFLDRLFRPAPEFLDPPDETVVCRCEAVTAGAIRGLVRIGCRGPNQMKAYSRAGMGPCQGRVCGLPVAEIIAAARGVGPGSVGYYRIRPPLKPVTVGELATLAADDAPLE